MSGSERNGSERNCTNEEGAGEKPKCRKMHGQNGGWEQREIVGISQETDVKWEARLKPRELKRTKGKECE